MPNSKIKKKDGSVPDRIYLSKARNVVGPNIVVDIDVIPNDGDGDLPIVTVQRTFPKNDYTAEDV